LSSIFVLVGRKRTADMAEHVSRSLGECLKMGLHVREQKIKMAALMVMRDHSSRDATEPFNTVGIGIMGRRIRAVMPSVHNAARAFLHPAASFY